MPQSAAQRRNAIQEALDAQRDIESIIAHTVAALRHSETAIAALAKVRGRRRSPVAFVLGDRRAALRTQAGTQPIAETSPSRAVQERATIMQPPIHGVRTSAWASAYAEDERSAAAGVLEGDFSVGCSGYSDGLLDGEADDAEASEAALEVPMWARLCGSPWYPSSYGQSH